VAAVPVGHAGPIRVEPDANRAVLPRGDVGFAQERGRAVLEVEEIEGPLRPGDGDPGRQPFRGVGLRGKGDLVDVDVHSLDTVEGEGGIGEEYRRLAVVGQGGGTDFRGVARRERPHDSHRCK